MKADATLQNQLRQLGFLSMQIAQQIEAIESQGLSKRDQISEWVEQHGEIVNKTRAAAIAGVSRSTIYDLIRSGAIDTAPNGNVLIRSLADWALNPPRLRRKRDSKGGTL